MANTKQIKIMVPEGQVAIIQKWISEGRFASVTAFCTSAVEKQIDNERKLIADYEKSNNGLVACSDVVYDSTKTEGRT